MTQLDLVRKALHTLDANHLEEFRKKLEHGQASWNPDQYHQLYIGRPDLRERMEGLLGIWRETLPRRDWVSIGIGAATSFAASLFGK